MGATVGVNGIAILFKLLIFILVSLILAGQYATAENHFRVESLPKAVKQGEVCLISGFGPLSLKFISMEFRGVRFPMTFNEQNGAYEGLIGFDMNTQPGLYEIRVIAKDRGNGFNVDAHSLKVERVNFGIQKLLLPSFMVNLDPKNRERVNKEAKQLQALFQGFRDERLWRGAFIIPVDGELSGAFGLRRMMNGQPQRPHTGVDLQAKEGTPVLACNSGMVALIAHFFLSGKSIILDHGWGLYSMYFHLSETLVKEEDRVSKGTMLGRVGSTGRSTEPHLHWGIRMNGARVDPTSLLNVTKHVELDPEMRQK
jgi:murein DD-endopeptidase MepM/ murein hydrolase activator NlpD